MPIAEKVNGINYEEIEIVLCKYVKELLEHPEKHSSQEIANLPMLLELCQKRAE